MYEMVHRINGICYRKRRKKIVIPQFHVVTISYVRTFMVKRFNSFSHSTSSPAIFPRLIIISVVKYSWHLPRHRIWRKSYTKSRLENVMTFVNSFIELSRFICGWRLKKNYIHQTFFWRFYFNYTYCEGKNNSQSSHTLK